MQLDFKGWVEQHHQCQTEGLISAINAAASAFCQEFTKTKQDQIEHDIDTKMDSETDALITLQNFYKKVAPRLDTKSKKGYEERLKSQLRRLGYDSSPDLLAKSLEAMLSKK